MQQGKPLGLAKNARGGICPAGRDCTFGGMPVGQAASEGTAFFAYKQIFSKKNHSMRDILCENKHSMREILYKYARFNTDR